MLSFFPSIIVFVISTLATHLGVPDQLKSTTLVRSETSNLANDALDEGVTLAAATLPARRALSDVALLRLVTALDTEDEACQEEGSKVS